MSLTTPLLTNSIKLAADWLSSGQLLAYPTESVWGIGCDPFNEMAVQQLLTIKQRPVAKGMIVVTDSVERIAPLLASLNFEQRQRVVDSWRGSASELSSQAQTWLLPLIQPLEIIIPKWITGAHSSVAVRVIAHPLIKQLCAQLITPSNPYGFLVSTSCNPSGELPAKNLAQAQAYFLQDSFINSNADNSISKVGFLAGQTLGYQQPSQINNALTGQVIR